MNKNDARWLCITIPSLLVKDKQEPKRIHSFKVVLLTPLAALKAHVLGFVTFFLNYHLYRVAQLLSKPPSPSAPPFSFLLFPNALLWSDDAPSVICEQRETMLCSSQLLNSPHASSGGTGGGAGGWQSVRSINMKYSALNIHIIY